MRKGNGEKGERGEEGGDVLNTNFSVGVSMYRLKVTSYWYRLRWMYPNTRWGEKARYKTGMARATYARSWSWFSAMVFWI